MTILHALSLATNAIADGFRDARHSAMNVSTADGSAAPQDVLEVAGSVVQIASFVLTHPACNVSGPHPVALVLRQIKALAADFDLLFQVVELPGAAGGHGFGLWQKETC